jgi:acetyl-CoA acetyltransferase
MVSQMEDFTSSRAFRVAGSKAFAEARHHPRRRRPPDDLRRPLFAARGRLRAPAGLEDLGIVPRGEAGAFITGHNTAPGGRLPLNTNGGGIS